MSEAYLVKGDPTLIIKDIVNEAKPVYDSWSDSVDEGRNSYSYVYKDNPKSSVPARCSVMFNSTAYFYYHYSGKKWNVTSPQAGSTVYLTPGSTVTLENDRSPTILGMENSGRLYVRCGVSDSGGSDLYFNFALTWEY